MGIIKSAKETLDSSTLVLGRKAEGKTSYVINELERKGLKNTLWIACDNTDTLKAALPDADVAVIHQWSDFEEVYKSLVLSDTKYDSVVIDGLSTLSSFFMDTTQYRLQDYGILGRKMLTHVAGLRGKFGDLYITLDLVPDEEGKTVLSVNRDLYRKITPFCNIRLCYVEASDKNLTYAVQTNSAKANKFRKN